ncbi:MAG: hypothetical protein WCK63_03225 [Betaproteobacteria bacterium]
MNIGSVGSTYGSYSSQAPQPSQVAAKGGRDNDGDNDGSGTKAVASTPAQAVNANGQKVGQVINVSA